MTGGRFPKTVTALLVNRDAQIRNELAFGDCPQLVTKELSDPAIVGPVAPGFDSAGESNTRQHDYDHGE
jgi:hypothetical protein